MGRPDTDSGGVSAALARPGLAAVLGVMFLYVLAHNTLYTYIAPLTAVWGDGIRVDLVLLVFGAAALAGIGLVGIAVDTHLRALMLGSVLLFAIAALTLGLHAGFARMSMVCVVAWGLSFGGAATLFQTAVAHAAWGLCRRGAVHCRNRLESCDCQRWIDRRDDHDITRPSGAATRSRSVAWFRVFDCLATFGSA